MLAGVVNEPFGTGVLAQIPGYTVAGKTGTAQKPVNGGYLRASMSSTFVGFLPAGNPQVEILVIGRLAPKRHLRRHGGRAGLRQNRRLVCPHLQRPSRQVRSRASLNRRMI